MKIESTVFGNNEKIPSIYTCDGQNINPPLKISDIPANAKSMALIMDDPDAPRGTFVHWVVWNINAETKEIPENTVPSESMEGITGRGMAGYIGPCPPSGTHRYFFKLYALDDKLDLPANTDKTGLEKAMENHIIAKGELMGLYGRK